MIRDNNYTIKDRLDRSKSKRPSQQVQSQSRESNYVINEFDKDILVIRNYDDVKIQTLIAYDVVLLDYFNPKKASEMLSDIRSSVYEEVYLKPVMLSTHGNTINLVDEEMADGVLTGNSIESVLDIVEGITKRVDEVLNVSSDFKGRKMMLKVIRFLYSRNRALKPIPTPKSHMGFAFPFLDANIQVEEYQELIDLLDSAEERGLMQIDFQDNVHLCHNCNSGFINYRETCSKCDTHKFKTQHTIHHFVCGYVGPESDYVSGNKLECPKCDRQLRHIGVDYDKPSLVMECENGHIFQETEMKTFCNGTVGMFTNLEPYVNREIVFGGVVTDVQHRVSKQGKGWALFTIEDYTDSFEFRIFGEEYLKFRHFLLKNSFVFVKTFVREGWVNKDTGKKSDPRLQFNSFQLLHDVMENYAKKLSIQVDIKDLNEQKIVALKELINMHPGNQALNFLVYDTQEKIKLNFEKNKQILINNNLLKLISDPTSTTISSELIISIGSGLSLISILNEDLPSSFMYGTLF